MDKVYKAAGVKMKTIYQDLKYEGKDCGSHHAGPRLINQLEPGDWIYANNKNKSDTHGNHSLVFLRRLAGSSGGRNGVYGLTKGQFSASADPGSMSKKGEANTMEAIDGALLALTLGATFVARSFSGDKAQLVPILKAGLRHKGFAFVDVISPCVTFNDHEGSTKSYAYTREKNVEVVQADFVPPTAAITAEYEPGSVRNVMLHDGSWVRLRKLADDYDHADRDRAYAYIRERAREGEVLTGLLYLQPDSSDVHEQNNIVSRPLTQLPYEDLCPGSAELEKLQARFR